MSNSTPRRMLMSKGRWFTYLRLEEEWEGFFFGGGIEGVCAIHYKILYYYCLWLFQ
jgi:hypothetical protein